MNELQPNGESPNVTSIGIAAPNEANFPGSGHVGASQPLGRSMSPCHPSNPHFMPDKTGSSSPQPKSASPMSPPDMRFSIGDARMGQPQSAVVAGKGSVPVSTDHVGTSAAFMKKAR